MRETGRRGFRELGFMQEAIMISKTMGQHGW